MINDNRRFQIVDKYIIYPEGRVNHIVNLGKTKEDFMEVIRDYIKEFKIASISVTIVYANAESDLSAPSGEGTMMNLYRLFKLYHQRKTK